MTIKEEIVAVDEIFAVIPVIEDALREPVLTVKLLRKGGDDEVVVPRPATVDVSCDVEIYPLVAKPLTVDCRVVSIKVVETKLSKLGVDTSPSRF